MAGITLTLTDEQVQEIVKAVYPHFQTWDVMPSDALIEEYVKDALERQVEAFRIYPEDYFLNSNHSDLPLFMDNKRMRDYEKTPEYQENMRLWKEQRDRLEDQAHG